MPYAKNSELPDAVKALPAAGQTMYRKTFNSALIQYKDESKAHATAWAQVKKSYKKVGDKWVAKEAKMPKVKERMSDDSKKQVLLAALNQKFKRDDQAYPHSPIPTIKDIYEESFVYDIGGSLFEIDYSVKDGKATLGEVTKNVIAQMVYTGIESLRQKYAEMIKEAGERGVEPPKEMIQVSTLIDSEEPDEGAVDLALSALDEAIEAIRLQEAIKTEDGVSYPSSAFAYVPDVNKPSTWKLRLWEGGKVTKSQLDHAQAALSPGGFRGNKVQISESALPGVKARIRAEYRKLGVEDIPKWVKETEVREKVTESCEIDIEEVTKAGIAKGIVPVLSLIHI